MLALLTLANFRSPEAIAAGQIRFAAYGQDPNDVARFLDLGFPLAALLSEQRIALAGAFAGSGLLPLGLVAVLLTASRGGFVAAIVAMAGCAVRSWREPIARCALGVLALPAVAAGLWFIIPA